MQTGNILRKIVKYKRALDFQGQILKKKVVSKNWDGRLTWNERGVSR